MLNVGGGELLIIFLVALIFLGPNRLPQVARQLGQTITSLRSLATGFQAEMEAAAGTKTYDGPMHLPTPQTPTPQAATQETPASEQTDAASLAQAARDVDVDSAAAAADSAADAASSDGPNDLRSDPVAEVSDAEDVTEPSPPEIDGDLA